jgi:hypothetical protein
VAGAAARRAAPPEHATPKQARAVQAVLRRNGEELLGLQREQMAALLPALRQAQQELQRELRGWVHRAEDGELRWTAWKHRSAIVQLQAGVLTLEHALGKQLRQGGTAAQRMAMSHLVDEVGRFSKIFRDVEAVSPLRFNLAVHLATGSSSRVARYESSAARYAWGRRGGVWQDLQQRLAVDILKGTPLWETADRLQQHGGPRGMVVTRGMAGEENALIEYIPEGLFARYRWRAEMYVRTEVVAAYGEQMREGLLSARSVLPDLMQRWSTDGGGCPKICRPMDGQVVGLHEHFTCGDGSTTDHEPAHPCCQCRTGPWRAHWPELLDSLGL